MALLPCKECGNDISSDASSCPLCGKTAPHKQVVSAGKGGAVLVGLIAFVGLANVLGSGGRTASTASAAASSAREPVAAQTTPAPTLPARPPISVGTHELWNAYEANEVAADKVYRDRTLVVSGTAASIDKNFLDKIVVSLASPNRFMPIPARMEPSEADLVAKFKKGQSLLLRCTGGRLIMGVPQLEACTVWR